MEFYSQINKVILYFLRKGITQLSKILKIKKLYESKI